MDDDPPSSSSPVTNQTAASDTPRQMPSFSTSRSSPGGGTPSSVAPNTPPPLPNGDHAMKEQVQDEDIGPLDPRRLTPNLHANLVSEILSLRRDIESKDSFIDRLESNLASEKSQHEDLEKQLAKKTKEARMIKRQLQSIEDGTLSALEELCKERDEANETVVDLRKRLEASQRHLKVEQEKNDRVHKSWDEEKLRWERERSQLQRKNDVAESRLQAVAEELVALQSSGDPEPSDIVSDTKDFAETNNEIGSLQSSPTKVRSHRRNRSSVSTIGSARPDSMMNRANLFDELDGDGDDTVSDGDFQENFEQRLAKSFTPREPVIQDDLAEKDAETLSEIEEADEKSSNDAQPFIDTTIITAQDGLQSDGSVTIPPGIAPESTGPVIPQEPAVRPLEQTDAGIEADQTPKKDPIVSGVPTHGRTTSEPVAGVKSSVIPSLRGNYNLPTSPKSVRSFVSGSSGATEDKLETASASTQTDSQTPKIDVLESPSPTRADAPASIQVPRISIHPPESGPSSPSETVLPPQTRNAGTQTDFASNFNFRSVSVQTDVIRVDQRGIKLPAHLLPSALQSAPEPSPHGAQSSSAKIFAGSIERGISPVPSPTDFEQQHLRQTTDDFTSYESFESNADESSWSRFRQSLMGNNRQTKATEGDPFQGNEDMGIGEGDSAAYLSQARSMKRPQKLGKPFDPPTPVPEDEKVIISKPVHTRGQASAGSRNSLDRSAINMRSNALPSTSKGKHARRPSERSGSPSSMASSSAWSKSTNPPAGVVIPQRTSSAGIRHGYVEGRHSPTRRTGASSPTRSRGAKRVGKPPMLRKIRSTSILSSEKRSDPNNRGLPLSPLSQASFASGEASPAPVPENSVLEIYRAGHQRSSSSQTRRLSAIHPTGNASVGSSIQHSVVDAIAATMVGEWMWKYVRKRRTFGMSDTSHEPVKNSDQRHKRWVWLSPYERTVMWSTKQPTTNSALMGKPGRKLTIQSVLDVKDDSVSSRSSASKGVFNRSILILTPSRALKFSATSRERHYLWLTALSFLAHHTSQGSLDLSFLPRSMASTPFNEPDPNVSRTTSASQSRNGRKPWSSKTTNRSQQSSGYATPSIPEATESTEGAAITIPAKPTRPAPQVPPQPTLPSDAAFPPNIPRVPDSRITTTYYGLPTKHGRRRSASITGVISLSSRPSSGRLQANGPTAASSYPTTATGNNSSNPSTKSGINHTTAPSARTPTSTASPPPPIPQATFSTSNRGAKYFGSSNRQPENSAAPDDPDLELANKSANVGLSLDGTRNFDWATKETNIGSTDFGGNNSFFDAVGGSVNASGLSSARQTDAFSGPGFERGVGGPPKRQPPPPPVPAHETSPALQSGHAPSDSVDSVAPPPIRRSGDRTPTTTPALPPVVNGPHLAIPPAEEKPIEKTKEAKKPYNPPQRKRARWGLGKSSAKKDAEAKAAAGPSVAVLAATADVDEMKVEKAHKGGQEII